MRVLATLAVALALRIAGIAWGLPPVNDHVRASGLRSSYAFDEDDILSGVAQAGVSRFDFDPHDYHWGTLHSELILLALDGAEACGLFPTPWRQAYYSLAADGFERVYVLGRLVTVAAALLTVWLLFRLAGSPGAFAAMLVAVSPVHVLQSDQVRVDVTMTAMLVLALLLAQACVQPGKQATSIGARQFLFLGLAAGLAVAAKYSAITAATAIVLTVLVFNRFRWRATLASAAGMIAGFLAGAPYFLLKPHAFYDSVNKAAQGTLHIPASFAISIPHLIQLRSVNLVRFSIGLPAALLAIAGLVWMLRRRSPADWILLAAIAAYSAVLLPLRWPLLRYDLPLIAMLGLCAGIALERLPPRWRIPAAALALLMPLCGAIAQIHYMRSPQPANLMLAKILETIPPGSPISRLMREAPPLDERIYPRGPNILLADLTANPPAWALTNDLPDQPYPGATVALLQNSYDQVAGYEIPRILGWSTFGETSAPHDWKYTHIRFTLYRRRQP